MFNKGQVSTEYLVILAIVLVAALVLVYLIGGFEAMGGSNFEAESLQAWGTAAPFSITSMKQAGPILQLEFRNSDLNALTLTGISMDNMIVYSANTTFNSGEKRLINMTTNGCGAPGSKFSHANVRITYNKGGLIGKSETGSKPLTGRCS